MSRGSLFYVFRLIVLCTSLCGFVAATSYAQDIEPMRASKPSYGFHGIYAWLQAMYKRSAQSDLDNSNVDGLAFYTWWSRIEPEQGVFDWTALDAHVNAATGAGKHFS